MTSELEEEFYDTFGIEKQMAAIVSCTPGYLKCEHCEYYKHIEEYKGRCTKLDYPDITAEKLLEMICICSSYIQNFDYGDSYVHDFLELGATNVQDLKEEILEKCIRCENESYNFEIKSKIQQLFKD